MPSWDKSRDYYADLGLSPFASQDEIKKQFRKLALKYHPDRNPGREADVNSKFQIIQSAHEILTDPHMKIQYDNSRRNPLSSGVKGNPWKDYGKEWQPPPTRNSTASPNKAPSGAERYAGFAGRAGKSPAKEDRQSWKSNAEAWESMRPNSTRRRPQTPPGRAPTSATGHSKATDSGSVPPRTAYQQQKAQASFGTRRTGYVPQSPVGDEPPVTNKNYFTSRDRSTPFKEAQPNTSTRFSPPDPLDQFKETIYDHRQSTPYRAPGGEKTRLHNPNLNTRGERVGPDLEPPMPGSYPFESAKGYDAFGESNASKGSGNDAESDDSAKFTKESARPANGQMPNGSGAAPTSEAGERYKPKAGQTNTVPQPPTGTAANLPKASEKVGETAPTASGGSAQATNGPSVYAPSAQSLKELESQFPQPGTRKERIAKMYSDRASEWLDAQSGSYSVDPSSGGGQKPTLLNFEQMQMNKLNHLINSRLEPDQKTSIHQPKKQAGLDSTNPTAKKPKFTADNAHHSSFRFPIGDDSGKGAGTERPSEHTSEKIDTRFVDELPDNLKFSAGTPAANDGGPRTAPFHIHPSTGDGLPLGQTQPSWTPKMPRATFEALGPGFSVGDWNDILGSHNFEPQPTRTHSTSPNRRTTVKKSKPVKMTAGTAGMVDEGDGEDHVEVPRSSSGPMPASVADATAMDIDSPPLGKVDPVLKVPQTKGARKIPVEPHREEWRAGDVNGVRTKSATPTGEAEQFAQKADPQPRPFVGQPQHVGSEDSEYLSTTFADFKNVEPFTDRNAKGLENFGDLKSTLPFPSQPSEHIPLHKEPSSSKPKQLEFPPVPVAPRLPPSAMAARPNIVHYRKYAQDFFVYLDKWENFNTKVMEHFKTRQLIYGDRRRRRGMTWLDTATAEYMAEVEQDQDVRLQWTQACADHQIRVREFMTYKEQVR
ncbi:hypothetical protein GGR54DRAFT_568530 [Hypoxylon sp. NC1633]|nr:hypothetical protein GGR54DRAFT_568530 [Hypoxylon sp. NC1633]